MTRYLLDTNSVIYFFNGEEKIAQIIESPDSEIYVSFITKIELLCFDAGDKVVTGKIEQFLNLINILFPDDKITVLAIEYRKKLKLKIPDAIICATAKAFKLNLVTADKELHKKLKSIKITSPV